MKKSFFAMALVFALVLATSQAMAAIVWDTGVISPATTYTEGANWSGGPVGSIAAVQGPAPTSGNLLLTLVFTGGGLSSDDNVYFRAKGINSTLPVAGNHYLQNDLGAVTAAMMPFSTTFNVTYNSAGVYAFAGNMVNTGDGSANWTLTRAYLSNSAKTPIPAAALLLGSGVLGLFGIGNKMRRKPS